jgi:hypothetical protein
MLPPSFLKIKPSSPVFEAREARGASDEVGVFNNRAASLSGAGGREKTYGFFVQDFARIGSRVVLAASARFDKWQNFAASSQQKRLRRIRRQCVNFQTARIGF